MKRMMLLASLALLLPGAAYADSITSATWHNYNSVDVILAGSTISTYSGYFTLTVSDTSPNGSNGYSWPGTTFDAFCADLQHTSSAPVEAQLESMAGWNEAGYGSPGGFYAAYLLDHWGIPSTLADKAAMQLAVWEALYENHSTYSFNVNTGQIYMSNTDSATLTQANLYLAPLNALSGTPNSFALWIVTTDTTGTVYSQDYTDPGPVPEPMSLLLLGSGLLGLSALVRFRRK